jgi:genome maintenance exonuclease 1
MLPRQHATFYGRKRFGQKERTALNSLTYPIVVAMPRVEEPDTRWYIEQDTEYPSVTSILNLTMPSSRSFLLSRWRRKKESELGVDGAVKLRDDIILRGTAIHAFIAQYLTGELKVEEIPADLMGYFHSFLHVLSDVSEPMAIETTVVHRKLRYAGTCDCIAKFRGQLCLIDWKTSDKLRPTLQDCYDFPIQAVAYAGAVNVDKSYPFKIDQVLVVVGYQDGMPAHVHFMPRMLCEEFWKKWLERLDAFRSIEFAEDFDSSTC